MVKIKNKILSVYRLIINSIAFYPTIIALGGFLSIFIITMLNSSEVIQKMVGFLPSALVVKDADTARTILSIIIGGLFSLTVFSFSMVMVVLNQAASNFSPRLLPGLISNKRHQIVLGVYIGSLIYCIFLLVNIQDKIGDATDFEVNKFGVLFSVILCIVCLGLFVYFIHSISQEVQISHILQRIFNDTKMRLQELIENKNRQMDKIPEVESWEEISGIETGYFQDFSILNLAQIAEKEDVTFYILPMKGGFVLKNMTVIKSSKKLEEEVIGEVLSCLQFSNTELVEENYILGFKQITEIAVKAMSPGINDPGTALNAIDYLSALFVLRLQIDDTQSYKSESDTTRIHIRVLKFQELIYTTFAALRVYCKHDVIIVRKLLQVLKYLYFQKTKQKEFQTIIHGEIKTLMIDAEASIENKRDLQTLQDYLKEFENNMTK